MSRYQYGIDYEVGDAGFTLIKGDPVSNAIGYGERRERRQAERKEKQVLPVVSHAFIVTGEKVGVEAHAENGVQEFLLSKYLNDPNCEVHFRKPRGMNTLTRLRLRELAYTTPPFKRPYDLLLVFTLGLNYTYLGNFFNTLTHGRFKRWSCSLIRIPGRYFCSMTVATIYQQIPQLKKLGCLRHPACTIDPQELFDDDEVFVPSSFNVKQASGV